ncbi:MAG: aspartyl/glutamyl-tRNA amidotransferase subunit C [Candidatus Vogelbacteria bacterium]|nr:aspartyl/glutamyl-tRNA amidotransferase subunit C [Candidatus Vogelbacteria bacterium]
MVEETELTQLALLARINLTGAERAGLLNDLRAILNYVDELKEVNPVRDRGSLRALAVSNGVNVLRVDNQPSGGETNILLAAAPRTQGGYFKVKTVLADKNGGS